MLPAGLEKYDCVFTVNLFHIIPVTLIEPFAALVQAVDAKTCVIYGAFRRDGKHTAESNEKFDSMLKTASDGVMGVKDVESQLIPAFAKHGYELSLSESCKAAKDNWFLVFKQSHGSSL